VCEFRRGRIVLWAILLLQISDVSQTIDSEGISVILPEYEGDHLSEHTFYRIQKLLVLSLFELSEAGCGHYSKQIH
jgi:hypothetical protein